MLTGRVSCLDHTCGPTDSCHENLRLSGKLLTGCRMHDCILLAEISHQLLDALMKKTFISFDTNDFVFGDICWKHSCLAQHEIYIINNPLYTSFLIVYKYKFHLQARVKS